MDLFRDKRRTLFIFCCVATTFIIFTYHFATTRDFLHMSSSTKSKYIIFSQSVKHESSPTENKDKSQRYQGKTADSNPVIESTSTGKKSSSTINRTSATITMSIATTTTPTQKSKTKKDSSSAEKSNKEKYLDPAVLSNTNLTQLKAKSQAADFSSAEIPKIVHQSWKDATLPPRFEKWSKTWKDCYPGWEYKLWTDKDNDEFVKTKFPWFYDRYKRLIRPVQKADSVRYLYMFAEGGIYTDLDNECLKPFENLLEKHPIVMGAMAGRWYQPGQSGYLEEGYTQNSFMYSVKGHPFWLDVAETIMNKPQSSSAEGTTGPFMLQEVISKWRKENPKRKHEIKIYDPKYFNPFSWITNPFPECKDVNRMTSDDIIKCKGHFPNAYVIQYHTQTWGRGQPNTFKNDHRDAGK